MVRHPPVTIPAGDTILDVLRWRAEHQPEQAAYVYLREGLNADTVLTYRDLVSRARRSPAIFKPGFPQGSDSSWFIHRVLNLCRPLGSPMPVSLPCRFRPGCVSGKSRCRASNASRKMPAPRQR